MIKAPNYYHLPRIDIPCQTKPNNLSSHFIPVLPIQCHDNKYDDDNCLCHYYQEQKVNIYNCSYETMFTVPSHLVNQTNWLEMENTQVTKLLGNREVLNMIELLDLSDSNVDFISEEFLDQINHSKTLKSLDLRQNRLTKIPKTMAQIQNLTRLWLRGNPIHCDCSMAWMIKWFNNFKRATGEHVIADYQDIKCQSGSMKGLPIYVLTEVVMGCYPAKLSTAQKVGIGVGTGIALILMICIFFAAKNPREIKFLMYYYLKVDTVPKDDRDENVDNMEYDAFFCYRYVHHILFRKLNWLADNYVYF